ncbi:H-type small acid-soluble spore protein [Pseudalkalibacillus berkeleyi]|uniref:H-type small acid-soluble spore protein n=1 Tax=Pseudalkalibacillus berkeleyi TaxID=1069813 RepID=A0ABS9H0D4_9BACL|nr:H-type small acid-soluble spore protein [Pseudalkalibacillus berkeleyi]MCF6138399.1 H-type small acid-soluble spore protein [Pseudalkalibacillus berkeleyi]
MNVGRAKQILDSPEEIAVHYKGDPVWIQRVDEAGNTARIYPQREPENEMTVNVTMLEEV